MLGMEEEGMEYSSGCESGWTMYLGNSSCGRSSSSEKVAPGLGWKSNIEDEDDMSMMSDASSPALPHQETGFLLGKPGFASAASSPALTRNSENLRRNTKRLQQEKRFPWMDDTASSYDVRFSETIHDDTMKWQEGSSSFYNYKEETVEDALEFSLGFSSNQSRGKKSREKKYRFFPTASSGQTSSNKPTSKEVNRGKVW